MLRMQQKTISPDTITALSSVTQLIGLLSKNYKLDEEGKLEL